MARHAQSRWNLPEDGAGLNWDHVSIAVLMDLRDELQRANRALERIAAVDEREERRRARLRAARRKRAAR